MILQKLRLIHKFRLQEKLMQKFILFPATMIGLVVAPMVMNLF